MGQASRAFHMTPFSFGVRNETLIAEFTSATRTFENELYTMRHRFLTIRTILGQDTINSRHDILLFQALMKPEIKKRDRLKRVRQENFP